MKNKKLIFASLLLAAALALSACGGKNQEPTPTPIDPNLVAQQAIQTFAMGLTMTAFAQPTATATLTPVPTNTSAPTFVVLGTTPTAVPTLSCNNAIWVQDITVPDGTPMAPGQAFTKTWLFKNVGTCTWTPTFKIAFAGIGIPMGGQPTPIGKTVAPNEQIQISVSLVAPTTSGDVESRWKLQDDSGNWFGETVWVRIKVAGPTPTEAEPTATSGP
ncbi:MAG: hypothetical protein HFACDABA_00342 [Anaerolineales bacterium]|nr:hypothetical protein [Anaerolineales bacterium]